MAGAEVARAGWDALWMSMWLFLRIIEAICRLNAVEAIEHGFNWDKSAMYAIEKSVRDCSHGEPWQSSVWYA